MTDTRPIVLCFGDSLTFGTPGISFRKHLKNKKRFINMGVDGDTLVGMSRRIQSCLSDTQAGEYLIEIGVNDLLLPHMETRSEAWALASSVMAHRDKIICRDAGRFEAAYRLLLEALSSHGKTVTVVNIPCIGEVTDSALNGKVDTYNRVIRALCLEHDVTLVDFNGWQKDRILLQGGESTYLLKDNPTGAVGDAFWTTWLPFSDWIGHRRGLVTTMDGIHLTDSSAQVLAALIEQAMAYGGVYV